MRVPLAPLQGRRGPPFVLLVCHSPILTHLLVLLVGAFGRPRRHHALVEAAAQVQIGTVALACLLACLLNRRVLALTPRGANERELCCLRQHDWMVRNVVGAE